LTVEQPPPPPTRGTVLVVDDVDANLRILERFLVLEGYTVRAVASGTAALASVGESLPDLVLLDVMMPEPDGFEVCRRLKADPKTCLIPIVLLTALTDRDSRIRGAEAGADDFISKPLDLHELRARVNSLIRLKRYTDDLDTAAAVIMSFAQIIEARDSYTRGHCQRLAIYGTALGRRLGLSSEELESLHRGGFLHDVGKVAVPDSVLLKPGPLNSAEHDIVKTHATVGDTLCGNLRALRAVRPIVRHHHERLDGSGYPDGLSGDSIPLVAQVVGVVDVFDALTTNRPYRRALPAPEAFDVLYTEVHQGWRSRRLVDEFYDLAAGGIFEAIAPTGVQHSRAFPHAGV
jgi:putative two-component system response regulator